MKFHNIFLKSYGLKGFIGDKLINKQNDIESGSIEITIQNDRVIKKVSEPHIVWYRNRIVKNIINWIYMVFVLCAVSWPCIFSIGKSIKESDAKYFFSNMFAFMYLSQYIIGIILYRNKFFSDSMKDTDEKNKVLLLLIYIVSCILVIILTVTSIMLLLFSVNINIFSDIYRNANAAEKVFLVIGIAIEKFYSYNIFFVNVIAFSYILIEHSKSIKSYKKKLNQIVKENINDISITDIIKEYTELKEYYSNSVRRLNNLFTSITIFGLFGCYFTIMNYDNKFIGVFTYIDVVCFIGVEAIYIYSINRIKKAANDIKDIISSTRFVIRFLDRSELSNIYGDIYENYNKNNSKDNEEEKIYIKDEIDKDPVLDKNKPKTGKKEKQKLSVTNTDDTDNKLHQLPNTKENIKVTPRFISPRSINRQIIMETLDEVSRNQPDINKKINIIKTILLRTSITTNENAIELDWIILYNKLLEDWENFKVFGFEFDDASIIQKLTIIVLGLIGILQLNDKIGL
ncbi:hypothetical protein QKU48_gp0521 [Fadolivirus algeromassiliense]|jgi:hypothetical protein|uniref:Uncharacterized protein n=1 Tax=Fadolivirus FV1/VV64 TaxID=3070911 RepID=A0A7D3QVV7_9VIRU|nr:hypothetical protein QKU48_gp0521 [Fadolivirus algeromassiliense]QKF93979.1 hypothetical protein Fadolivirus_1_521 [Fadolivirus FV1/VV64]